MEEFATRIGDKPDDAETRASIDFATGRPGWYLRYRHIDGYGDLVKDIGEWIDELVEFRGKVTLESALEWKKSVKHKASDKDKKGGKDGDGWAERLVAKEREAQLPRGADAFEIARWLSDRSKFTVSPINWRVDQHADREGRWGEGRTILLLAGLMRHVISLQDRAAKADVLVRLQDFTQKIRWNCSFDIALERLYFALAGLVS
jgi:hypothetical protein